jgi:hypothetical protein
MLHSEAIYISNETIPLITCKSHLKSLLIESCSALFHTVLSEISANITAIDNREVTQPSVYNDGNYLSQNCF